MGNEVMLALQNKYIYLTLFFQLSSMGKAINSSEMPVKEKHARRILY